MVARNRRLKGDSRAMRSPRLRNSCVSCAPIDTTGTIGAPDSSAASMKPLRPPKSMVADLLVGRQAS
jgi:hypothetical protein